MAKESKVESNSPTMVAEGAPTLDESPPATKVASGWLGAWRRWTGRLSHSTQFIIAASVILGLTMFFVGDLVSERVKSAALQSAAEAGALYMQTFLEPYVQEMSDHTDISAQSTESLDKLLSNPTLRRHIESVKIWRADGTVVYSTDKTIVRQRFPTDEIEVALRGHVVTDLEDLSQDENRFERTLQMPLYEIYAPLRDSRSGKVIAVGEFYERADWLEKEIARIRAQVWRVVGAATLAMLLLLFGFVRRSERIIQRQQADLRTRMAEQVHLLRRNDQLQQRIANANQQFWRINELTLRRLGADLHDGPAQLLTLILIRLDDLAEALAPVDQESEGRDTYESIRGAAQDALREVRDISRGLALPEIGELSLADELTLAAKRHEERTGSKVEVELGSLPQSAPLPLKICLYRFVQESLSNAFKHAAGQGQKLSADYDGKLLHVTVVDSGPGFEVGAENNHRDGRPHLGLAGLRYRVESFGGVFDIESAPGRGTRVSARLRL
ncbi:sensor histidine kinase [Pseudomonas knackmussii]|uniref:sensor histidine kinase n=1 Tax=Pseudomonas knackmussii TaxID=65741 RepID=UPI003BC41B37